MEHIVVHMHLNFVFKWALHFSTLVTKLFTLAFFGFNWQSILPFSTHTTRPLLKLKQSVLLAIKGW